MDQQDGRSGGPPTSATADVIVSLEEAADILKIPLPRLMGAIENGSLLLQPDMHGRVNMADVERVQEERLRTRRALDEIVRISEEMGLYERQHELYKDNENWKRTR